MPDIITMFVPYHNVISTDLYCTIHAKISPLCHFRANACGVPSNPEGAPAGGISALAYDFVI